METTRDLGCPELWQESLERSLARRGKLPRSSVELHRLAPGRDLVGSDRVEESATYWKLRRRPFKRAAFPVLGAGGASAVALLAASTLPSLSGLRAAGHGHGEPFALLRDASTTSGVRRGGYANPLAGAHLTPERIDQGVDYSGSGPLKALGGATITYVGTSNTGWPGAFIEYRLAGGRYAGRYVYCAEGVSPVPGLHTGQRVRAGQKVAQIIAGWSSGIEIGWGAGIGTETYAMAHRQWGPSADAGNVASQAGKRFSALIASLGGPPGIVEG